MIAALFLTALVPSIDAPFREITFDQALAAAKAENKIVMADFYTDWCQPCKLMDINTWKDKTVHEWFAKNAVPIKIDADEEKEIAARYNVKGYPSMLFIRANGEELDRTVGFRTPQDFLTEADQIVAGNGVLQRVREKLKGREQDPEVRQELARALASRARYEEALNEYLWCFDRGSGASDKKLLQLLPELMQFASTYQPARTALEERRGKAEAAVLAGGGAPVAREMAALNENLQVASRTLDVYRELESRKALSAEVKDALLDDVVDLLLGTGNHDEVVRLVGDVDTWAQYEFGPLKALESRVDAVTGQLKSEGSAELSAARQTRARRAVRVYEAFLAAQQPEKANAIADKMLAAIPFGSSYAILIESAIAANDSNAARAFVKKGEAVLSPTELRRVKIAAKKIPWPE